jgi:K+-sensing histidine kinase KdpD
VFEKFKGYLAGTIALALAILILLPLRDHVNTTTIAMSLLIIVLLTATTFGSSPAFVVSILSIVSFNFFFLPPYHTFVIEDPQNWVALSAFLLTSLIAGSLSAREKRRALEAESRKKEAEQLYAELQTAFEKASQAEAFKQSERLKSALLDAVTHDLRTPLTSMKAAVTTLVAGSKDSSFTLDEEGRHELLEVIDTEIDRLNKIFESLLGMARIEAGTMEPRQQWSSMEEIISNALARAGEIPRSHRIHVAMEKDLPPVRVDEKLIAEVVHILIDNATKFSPPGKDINLAITRNGADMKVTVEDEGIGIPLSAREKVFEKFFRFADTGASTRQPAATGLGMGLAIARGIIEAHKGRIWIEDGPRGVGTRVNFTIPMAGLEISRA